MILKKDLQIWFLLMKKNDFKEKNFKYDFYWWKRMILKKEF